MSEELLETMEKYLLNELPPEDVKSFEAKLRADERLAEQFSAMIHAHAAIDAEGYQNMGRDLSQWGRELIKEEQADRIKTGRWKLWGGVAAVILLFFGIYLTISNSSAPAPQDLYAAHFSLLPTTTSRSETHDSVWQVGVRAYDQGKHIEAIEEWETIPDSAFTPETNLYLGLSYLAENEASKAITYLEKLQAGSILFERAQWYLALAWLKLGQVDKSKEILQTIVDSGSHFQINAAREILDELD